MAASSPFSSFLFLPPPTPPKLMPLNRLILKPGPAPLTVLPRQGVGPTLPSTAAGKGWAQLCTASRLQHGPRFRPRAEQLPAVIDGHCCRATDPDTPLGGSTGHDLTMALGSITGYSLLELPVPPPSLHCVYIFLLLFLCHLSTTYLLIILAMPSASGSLT